MARGAPDPRTIITPDAFEVSPDLLGLPLADPLRRGTATLLDLVLIGLITLVTRDMGIVVGVAIATLFVVMAVRSPVTKDLPPPLVWGFRFSIGCLGLIILLVSSATVWWLRSGPDLDEVDVTLQGGEEARAVGLRDLIGGVQGGVRFTEARTAADAEAAAVVIARAAMASGLDAAAVEDLLEDLVPEDGAWSDESDEVIERAIAAVSAERGIAEAPEPAVEVGGLAPEAALLAYARRLESAPTDSAADAAAEDPELAALRRLALPALAADTLRELEDRVAALERAETRRVESLEEANARINELEEGSGLVRLAGQLIDQLGLAFGWGSVYFALLLPWWKGQTPGKKILGVRVLRLDGGPITWWFAFERAGGYAAGFATGLLGFAQVYWDPNRQAIHDKIAGTVVIRDGMPRVPGTVVAPPPQ